ncbi:MAG TPA: tetratricopeptide repeat protein, partial [Actinomycetota bacterium]
DHLADKELLLLLDNFEQVAQAGPVLEDLLGSASGLTALATSRRPLSVRGEQEYLVPPLDPPDTERLPDLPMLREIDGVRLFLERAASVAPRFEMTEENAPAIAAIVARLDGLPLAVELAATQTKLLSPEEIAARLDERLTTVGTGARAAPQRQRTLRDAIAWSYQLLGEPERRLFARLSVFSGGWTVEAAEAVCEPDSLGPDLLELLGSLVDHSLVRRLETPEAESRYSMLETIREFGREQLRAGGEEEAIARRHGEHFLGLAVEAEPHFESDPAWLARCEAEHDNIRAALRWAIAAGEPDLSQVAAGALWRFWRTRGYLMEARLWFDEVLGLPQGDRPTAARAKALTGAGGIAWWRGEVPESRAAYEEALAIERELGDRRRIAEALYDLAHPLWIQEGLEAAVAVAEESLELFREVGDESGVARALGVPRQVSWTLPA